MPTKYKDYPVYTYDEPSTHSDFTGGINTDPSNEHLAESEMRDCVNMHYLSGALVKRKGAELLSRLICDEELTNIQGIFLYTYKLTYIIVAANGKLYYGIYNEEVDIELTRLYIEQTLGATNLIYNPLDVLVGLDEFSYEIESKHDGYVQTYYKNNSTEEKLLSNNRGTYEDITSGSFSKGDIVTSMQKGLLRKYLCIEPFEKVVIKPTNLTYWHQIYTEDTCPAWSQEQIEYNVGDRVLYNSFKYECVANHYNFYTLPNVENLQESHLMSDVEAQTTLNVKFKCIDDDHLQGWSKLTYLIFQNYRPVECASINNNLIIATGTRIIEIYPFNNELKAKPIVPYTINNSELINIGYNYMSPYPELAIASQKETVSTQVYSIKVEKVLGGMFKLTPILSIAQGDSINNYKFRWEKLIDGNWYCIQTFKSQFPIYENGLLQKIDTNTVPYELLVTDADKYQYRITMAKYFENPTEPVDEWSISKNYFVGDIVMYNNVFYRCIYSYNSEDIKYDNNSFNIMARLKETKDGISNFKDDYTYIWQEIFEEETILKLNTFTDVVYYPNKYCQDNENNEQLWLRVTEPITEKTEHLASLPEWEKSYDKLFHVNDNVCFSYTEINNNNEAITYYVEYLCLKEHFSMIEAVSYKTDTDYKVNLTLEVENHTAISVTLNDLDIEDTFLTINSCTKVLADGYKLLFYGDLYNSGMWFKTIISNPYYITDRGNLSFKTRKNEEVIKVIPFQGNLIVFANAENVGGSIHIVSGNGDDYNASDGYYSPYQRRTINSMISCDNANTIQVCDNILVFKYFNRVYYINASDLDNEVVKVTACNDRVLSKNSNVAIPWDDNSCISVVTKDYYALIWKEKYTLDDNNELVLEHPGMRVKLYYKLATQIQNNIYSMPWLRDESEYFNCDYILYAKGNPLYLYNNLLLNFDGNSYEDLGEIVPTKILLRGYDLQYPKLIKLVHSIILYYHRNQASQIELQVTVKNEAGHVIIEHSDSKQSVQDLRVLFANKEKHLATNLRLDSTIQDIKVINASYAFPALLVDAEIITNNKGEFSLSSVTFTYTTSEAPDTTQFDLYNSIIRPRDIKGGLR